MGDNDEYGKCLWCFRVISWSKNLIPFNLGVLGGWLMNEQGFSYLGSWKMVYKSWFFAYLIS